MAASTGPEVRRVIIDGDTPRSLPLEARDALEQLWRQSHRHGGEMSRELLRTVARPIGWTAFAAGLSADDVILGVTQSWLTAEKLRSNGSDHRFRDFATLLLLSVEEFKRALEASQARAEALDRLERAEMDADVVRSRRRSRPHPATSEAEVFQLRQGAALP